MIDLSNIMIHEICIGAAAAARFCGVSERTLSRHKVPTIDIDGYKIYLKSDLKKVEKRGRGNPGFRTKAVVSVNLTNKKHQK